MYKISAIIPAGGTGKRFGTEIPKQFAVLDGEPIIIRTIKTFEIHPSISSIVISINKDWKEFLVELLLKYNFQKIKEIVIGGINRQDSVYNALITNTASNSDYILVHDAVRPIIDMELIDRIIGATIEFGAAIPVTKIKDTIKQTDTNGYVSKTLDRDDIVFIQTPQGFNYKILKESYEKLKFLKAIVTDDASIVELAGHKVKTVEGIQENIKITNQEDLIIADSFIKKIT